jgi:uncharacterized protein RhaS with RHS repeats
VYDPTLGRWLQQDPIGDINSAVTFDAATRNALAGATKILQQSLGKGRAPTAAKDYADGMDLYQYEISSPIDRADPTGEGQVPGGSTILPAPRRSAPASSRPG